jgi:tetratricopeptide (TPR) repeat protein
LGNNELSIGYY